MEFQVVNGATPYVGAIVFQNRAGISFAIPSITTKPTPQGFTSKANNNALQNG